MTLSIQTPDAHYMIAAALVRSLAKDLPMNVVAATPQRLAQAPKRKPYSAGIYA